MAEEKKTQEFKQPITTEEKLLVGGGLATLLIIAIPILSGNTNLLGLFVFGGLILGFTPYVMVLYLKDVRQRAIEEQFPNFLRDVSGSKKAGMTLPLAIAKCATSDYGALTEEVKRMEEQISWGIPFDEALKRFGDRIGSSFIKKSTTIIIEAYRSGGAISDVLESVAEDAKMIRESEKEKHTTLSQYVTTVYIIHFLFIAILISLNKILGPIASAPGVSGVSSTSMPGIGGGAGGVDLDRFKPLFFHMSIIQGFFNGLLAGQIGENSVISGLKHSLFFILVSIALFFIFMFDYKAICLVQPTLEAMQAAGCIAASS